jgi:hypothetical protein
MPHMLKLVCLMCWRLSRTVSNSLTTCLKHMEPAGTMHQQPSVRASAPLAAAAGTPSALRALRPKEQRPVMSSMHSTQVFRRFQKKIPGLLYIVGVRVYLRPYHRHATHVWHVCWKFQLACRSSADLRDFECGSADWRGHGPN